MEYEWTTYYIQEADEEMDGGDGEAKAQAQVLYL